MMEIISDLKGKKLFIVENEKIDKYLIKLVNFSFELFKRKVLSYTSCLIFSDNTWTK